ncbi:MAG: NADPH-dependent F420 reductase [Candidatus Korobacteraceae bacterium]
MNDQLPDWHTIAILGGTGPEGQGLAVRWARAGLHVILGSRDDNRARLAAQELAERSGGEIEGMENSAAVAASDVVVLAVPFDAQISTLKHVAAFFRKGAVLLTTVVPLASAVNDRSTRLLGIWQGSAAELAAELVPAHVSVVGAFHNVAASLLNSTGPVDCDVVVCADDVRARRTAFELAARIPGVRPVNGGNLENSRIVEAMNALLIGINIRYKVHTAAIRITGLPEEPA